MTHSVPKATPYPRSHLLAASGIAALLSLALLVFPSREVEAKKTYLSLELDNSSEQIVQEKDDLRPDQAAGESPFADNNSAQVDANKKNEAAQLTQPTAPLQKSVTVANGDTLSTVFSRVGLNANALHEAIGSSKDAKRFSRLHVGQVLDFKLTPEGKLERLSSKLNDLESISLNRSDKGFSFKRELVKPDVRTMASSTALCSSPPSVQACRTA
jgi:cell envelope opacity-associated protein A